ncbi:lysophospholipid acyltransferase family protein [Kaistella faecalis]|uniref:lysophospholipid acyltransferase family protein n=1 Tax=Kaistella faecalis TaxID=2852098 RepID=UPI001C48B4C7|nr:lysophospholipid acyltransferase family protein [Chryseobacterium faecale]UFK97460.1 lysophospholipid acyltransferase family protein [Chryseobacterium faecale]
MNFLFKIILLFSRLPLQVLYLFSDVIFFLMYHLVGYRKKVVTENLKKSFPEKSVVEISTIRKSFYRNFSDYILETFKSFTISSTELRVRVQHINQDVFKDAKAENKNVILLAGHIFNWEWFNALATIIPQENCFPVYRKVQNSFWEEKIKGIRNSFGNQALEAKEVIRHIFRNRNDGNSVYMFIADQTPHVSEVTYGLNFLNQKTPAFVGYDKLSTRMDLAFVFCEMKKVKRGYYQINYYRIYPDGEKFVEHEVVRKFHKMLENTINKRPDNYLWSHRRWKYQHAIKVMETGI